MKIGTEDPRLTAYALGEPVAPEVEAAIEEDEELREEVVAIQEVAAVLASSLRAGAVVGMSPEQRAIVVERARQESKPAKSEVASSGADGRRAPRLPRRPQLSRRLKVTALAVAGLTVACGLCGAPSRAAQVLYLGLYPWLTSIRDSDSQADFARGLHPVIPADDALAYVLGLKSAESVGVESRQGDRGPTGYESYDGQPASGSAGREAALVATPGLPAALNEMRVVEEGYGAPAAGAGGDTSAKPSSGPALTGTEAFGDVGVRRIVKNGSLMVEVKNLRLAMSRLTASTVELGGYILETQTYDYGEEGYGHATVTVAVPVDNFEALLDRIRRLAERVLSETASGRDTSREYVDLQSQIANLEATQARVREFLNQARTVEEALRVNAKLTEIEGQISQLKGQLQYLGQRAAYSTVTVDLVQSGHGATPTPAGVSWQPDRTARRAARTLASVLRVLGDLAIWLAIVLLPLALPLAAVAHAVHRVKGRMPRSSSGHTPE